jgi:hypothetical protein
MRIYVIGNDGITLSREAPVALNEGEIAVASNKELHAAPLSGKRLLALWNALPAQYVSEPELTEEADWLSLNVTGAPYRSDNGRGGSSTSGGTGNAPVCCAKWCARRREIVIPVTIALPKTIKAMATTPAISTISIWIAMVYPLAPLLSLRIWDRGAAGDTRVRREASWPLPHALYSLPSRQVGDGVLARKGARHRAPSCSASQ